MAKILNVTKDMNVHVIANLAGSKRLGQLLYHGPEKKLIVRDVNQNSLDAAFADYLDNRSQREADFKSIESDEKETREENEFNKTKSLKAVVGFLVEQINELRVAQSLPPITFDFKSEMKKVK